jgi:hypothetical protein
LSESPSFLSEELALEKAKLALRLDGYEIDRWMVEEEKRTEAPDGTPDRFLLRNHGNPNRGDFTFTNQDELKRQRVVQRLVIVEIRDRTVVCIIVRPK